MILFELSLAFVYSKGIVMEVLKWMLDLPHNTHEDEQSMDNTFGVFTNKDRIKVLIFSVRRSYTLLTQMKDVITHKSDLW